MKLKITPKGKLVEKKSILIMIEDRVVGRVWEDDILLDSSMLTINNRPVVSGYNGSI